jgi:CCR4-NOT transcription complex subunit 1
MKWISVDQFTEYGIDGSLILLRNCLEQINLHQGEVHNLPLKLDLLARILKTLIHQPNSGSILCEALGHTSSFSEGFLENICSALKFSIPEQIGLGLALSDAEDQHLREEG